MSSSMRVRDIMGVVNFLVALLLHALLVSRRACVSSWTCEATARIMPPATSRPVSCVVCAWTVPISRRCTMGAAPSESTILNTFWNLGSIRLHTLSHFSVRIFGNINRYNLYSVQSRTIGIAFRSFRGIRESRFNATFIHRGQFEDQIRSVSETCRELLPVSLDVSRHVA